MKRFKVTLMVPHSTVIEAADMQAAHNHVYKMMQNQPDPDANPGTKVHSIVEVEDPAEINFDSPPEA